MKKSSGETGCGHPTVKKCSSDEQKAVESCGESDRAFYMETLQFSGTLCSQLHSQPLGWFFKFLNVYKSNYFLALWPSSPRHTQSC